MPYKEPTSIGLRIELKNEIDRIMKEYGIETYDAFFRMVIDDIRGGMNE